VARRHGEEPPQWTRLDELRPHPDGGGALRRVERAAVYTPAYATLEINRGIVAGALGKKDEAERHFRRALELNPDRDAHFFFARWLLRVGRGVEAETHLAESARLAPTWLPPRRLALQVAIARGDAARARALAGAITAIDPSDEEALAVRRAGLDGRCASYRRCFDEAWRATNDDRHVDAAVRYRAALTFQQTAIAHNNLGWSLASLGFGKEAVAAYVNALTVDPTFTRAQNNLLTLRRQ
jgi:tetratricopeptide (TPR) repeat protein